MVYSRGLWLRCGFQSGSLAPLGFPVGVSVSAMVYSRGLWCCYGFQSGSLVLLWFPVGVSGSAVVYSRGLWLRCGFQSGSLDPLWFTVGVSGSAEVSSRGLWLRYGLQSGSLVLLWFPVGVSGAAMVSSRGLWLCYGFQSGSLAPLWFSVGVSGSAVVYIGVSGSAVVYSRGLWLRYGFQSGSLAPLWFSVGVSGSAVVFSQGLWLRCGFKSGSLAPLRFTVGVSGSATVYRFMSGSLCPPEVMKKLKTDMNVNDMIIGYGTTENSPVTFLGFLRDNEELKTETVGCILNHTEAKVVDVSSGEVVPLGDPGELLIRAYSVMLEYWEDPDKTSEAIAKDRWYRTGDIASLDRFGYCRIVGRIKDMIIRGGENIYPAEIEKFLHTHPNVQEAQVIGVRDERLGEQVCACIRLKEGLDCSREEIRDFCKGQISHFKIPHYVVFVDSYPLTASGKIQKNKLREEMEKKLAL
ncbi:medium-chain acyl-CoA ligase ACSF2, mitochondrial-like [Oncorhynchus masou masou]|uniref:medium-chain acyl-CoA ligase ACSF2, mitochondrial-like n=1 Tax=Oncorhynchus masou masou TaxID=90313 RepID=UPI0031836686